MAIDPLPDTDAVVDDAVAFLDARGLGESAAIERVAALVGRLPCGAVVTVRFVAPPPSAIGTGTDGSTAADVVMVLDEPPDVIVVLRVR